MAQTQKACKNEKKAKTDKQLKSNFHLTTTIMQRLIQAIVSLLLFGLLSTAIAAAVNKMSGVPPALTVSAMVLATLLYAYRQMAKFDKGISNDRYRQFLSRSGIQVEIWAKYILGAIFRNNQFLDYCFKADDYVLQGKVVHIPQAGGTATVVKNRTDLPATVTKRTDTDITYPLDEFTTNPRLIPHADTVELSYDKMDSVMTDDMNALRQVVADNILNSWAPASNIIRTTGAAVDTHLADTIGVRKKFTSKDLKSAQKFLNKHDIPTEGRYALLSADMYDQLVDDLSETQQRDFSRVLDEKRGIVAKLYGFNIMMRSRVVTYNNAETPVLNAYGAESDDADNDAALCWHESAVERAMGSVVPFNQDNSPQYYGDLMSFLLRMGGRIRRSDEKGIVAVVQAAG